MGLINMDFNKLDKSQENIISNFEKAKKHLLIINAIVRDEQPLTHKNASAVRGEINSMIRHINRSISWVQESQIEEVY